jgi:hypothetical protein
MSINLKEIRELLNLSEAGASVYVELLTHGEISLKQLNLFTNYSLDELKKGISELYEKHLIQNVTSSEGDELYHPLSTLQIEERLAMEKEALLNLKKFIIPQFEEPQKLGIVKYEGCEGIRQVYLEILEEAIKTGEDIYAFENKISDTAIGEIFLENYIKKRLSSKVKAFVICPNTTQDQIYKENYSGKYTEVKLIKDFKLDANINIVGNLVMTFSINPHQGTLRRDLAEANTFKSIFKVLWDSV